MTFSMIAPDELSTCMTDERCQLIDLREPEEYRKRHLKNAVNVPWHNWKEFERSEEFQKLYRKKKLILYCERGPTSFAIAKELAEQGIYVEVLVGGIRACRGKMG